MKEFDVVILPKAEEDIERNARWWAENRDVDQAVKWFFTVRDQISSLKHQPESHGLSAENSDFPYEIRDRLIGLGSRPSYRAVLTIRDETVFVLAVLRSSQDVLRTGDVDFDIDA
jgi:plasmid stabilization system protein ParE